MSLGVKLPQEVKGDSDWLEKKKLIENRIRCTTVFQGNLGEGGRKEDLQKSVTPSIPWRDYENLYSGGIRLDSFARYSLVCGPVYHLYNVNIRLSWNIWLICNFSWAVREKYLSSLACPQAPTDSLLALPRAACRETHSASLLQDPSSKCYLNTFLINGQ